MVHKITMTFGAEGMRKINEALTKKQLHDKSVEVRKDRELKEQLRTPIITGDNQDESL